MKKRKIYPTTLLLFGFIAVVTLADLVNPVRAFSEMENRELKTTSQFTLSRLFKGDFQSQYEKVVADQFVGRDEWITLKSMTESALLKTENNGVIYGKNGALFGKLTSYNETQLDRNVGFLSQFAAAHDNITVGIIPSSYTYSLDQLPAGSGQIDQLPIISDIQQNLSGSVEWFDAAGLLAAQQSESLYYNTDHHWRGTTAYLAYSALCEQMGLEPISESELTLREVEDFYGSYFSKCKKAGTQPDTLTFYDLPFPMAVTVDGVQKDGWYDAAQLDKRDKYGAFLYGNGGLTILSRVDRQTKETDIAASRLLLIKDSFSNALAPLFLNNFDEVYIVDLRSYPMGMTQLCEETGFDEIVVLYNFENLESDTNFYRIIQ